MDPVINSLVQSPLVRTLNSVPSKAQSFTYGISDNVPPCSFDRMVLSAQSKPAGRGVGEWKFKIPQFGYLNKAYLRIRYTGEVGTTYPDLAAEALVTKAELKTHNRVIQQMYGKECVFEALTTADEGYDSMKAAMHGWQNSAAEASPNTPSVTGAVDHLVYLPLPLASTASPAHNFQTRFVEDMDIDVTIAAASVLGVAGACNSVELIVHFHNFHDNIENSIRNENYKRGIPASVLQRSVVDERAPTLVGNFTLQWNVTANQLAYGFLVVIGKANPGGIGHIVPITRIMPTNITVTGSGRELYRSNGIENNTFDDKSFSLVTKPNRAHRLPGTKYEETGKFWIGWGFDRNHVVNTGSVGLQTINNVVVQVTYAEDIRTLVDVNQCSLLVYHRLMVRIDSDSGVIDRAMDV
jgi:hypothetical protein